MFQLGIKYMKYWHDEIKCESHFPKTLRTAPFIIVVYQFDYSNPQDRVLINRIVLQSSRLAQSVYDGAANNSESHRSTQRILANCIAGLTAEYCWRHFLNFKKETVRTTPFNSAANQIDLEVISNQKKIEVRSSFPRNGIPFAICHPQKEFDILGPYANTYKPGEPIKDYYVRTLFHLATPFEILQKIKSSEFIVYLTGGATRDMMFNNDLSIVKDLIPEDSFQTQQAATTYRVVPYHNALDCRQIYHLITNEK